MTKPADNIGRRIAMYRKMFGYKNTFELADAIDNPRISHAVIANIESGRRADPFVSEVVEIARGLGISPMFLLTPALMPTAEVDLANLSEETEGISSEEFIRWFMMDNSTLIKRELPQINLYQAFKNVHLLFKLQKASQQSRDKLHELSNAVPANRNLYDQAWELYQTDLHDWYNLLMALTNVPFLDLSWTDHSLVQDIDLNFQPAESPRYTREGKFIRGLI